MADSREPPPFGEEDSSFKEEENDAFLSTVTGLEKASRPYQVDVSSVMQPSGNDLMSGGGVEVSLDDDLFPSSPQSKLEFHTPEEDTLKFSDSHQSVDISPPAELAPSAPLAAAVLNPSIERKTVKPDDAIKSLEQFEPGLEIKVSEPQKVGDGMGAYVIYKVNTITNLPYFKKKNITVNRRFSDFLGLHGKLAEKHIHLGRIVPPAPEKSVIGMTKIKMSTEESVTQGDFIGKRRASLERYLNRTAAHPILRIDPDFREFLELESDLPRATNTSALSGAGIMRLFNRVGDTVNKITFKMDESDPWFEEKQHQIENLDQQMRKLHSSIEALVHHRRDLSVTTASFAKSTAMLGNCEEHTSLSRALSQLAEVEEKVEQLYSKQSSDDFYQLSELIRDYVCLIGSVKDVFHQRVKVYQTWQHAQQVLTKKREQKAKLELAGKTDKVPLARDEVIEWEAKVERGQEEFENISKMIHKEVEQFERARIVDFKISIVKYMETLLETQQQLIKYWEMFLPEAKTII